MCLCVEELWPIRYSFQYSFHNSVVIGPNGSIRIQNQCAHGHILHPVAFDVSKINEQQNQMKRKIGWNEQRDQEIVVCTKNDGTS